MKLNEGSEEFQALRKAWLERARELTLKELPDFLRGLLEHEHDYGTICHAFAVGAVAAMRALDKEPQGGITGFQASCIMWEVIRLWMSRETPMRLVDYERMLFPQYAEAFAPRLSPSVWAWLQAQACERIEKLEAAPADGSDTPGELAPGRVHPAVLEHWRSIARGEVPFGYSVEEEPSDEGRRVAGASEGARLIAEERRRQVTVKCWTSEHDDEHDDGALAVVAAHLATLGTDAHVEDPCGRVGAEDADDPLAGAWGLTAKYRDDPVRRLVIAGALIAAEIDRLVRVKSREEVRGE